MCSKDAKMQDLKRNEWSCSRLNLAVYVYKLKLNFQTNREAYLYEAYL